MKKKYAFGGILLLFIGFAWWANSEAGKEFVRKDKERQAAEERTNPTSLDKKASLFNTVWESPEIGYNSNAPGQDVVVLSFYADSVTFSLPHGSAIDASWLLGGRPYGKKTYYSWNYSVKGNTIILDPDFTGFAVPIEMTGDSLVWKGKSRNQFEQFVLRRVR